MKMTQPYTQLLNALAENSLVKAAVVMDGQGRVRGRTGSAAVLRSTSTVQINAPSAAAPAENKRENVYMVAIDHDLLLVVFDESSQFERVRTAVDMLVKSFIPSAAT
jgi:uncharacterized membrane protein affecting hemolysin expression